ncbi:MAG: EamA family transporter [Bacteroidota bacterium]|jgi:membrane protein
MLKTVLLTLLQCLLMASGQVCFKLAVEKITEFRLSMAWFADILTNWWLLISGLSLVAATILWGYILKHFDFSVTYPLTAFAYMFGMLAAAFIFGENIPMTRWIGVGLIIVGVMLIVK